MTAQKRRRGRPRKTFEDHAKEAALVLEVAAVLRRGVFRPTKVDANTGRVLVVDWSGDVQWLKARGFSPDAITGTEVYKAAVDFVKKRRRGIVGALIGKCSLPGEGDARNGKLGVLTIRSTEGAITSATFTPDPSKPRAVIARQLIAEDGLSRYRAAKLTRTDPRNLRRPRGAGRR